MAISPATVSAVFVKEEDKVQKLVYYANQALHGAEERYPPMEKLAFALVIATCKLKTYFQAHTVIILTEKPLRREISNPKAAGRLTLWAIEFSEFDIQYRSRIAIKGQVVADFITEFTNGEDKGVEECPWWSIYINGSSNRQASGASIVLFSPEEDNIECMVRLGFPTTNNEAKYEALVARLNLAKEAGAASVVIHYDSQVVTNQVNGDYECKGWKKEEIP